MQSRVVGRWPERNMSLRRLNARKYVAVLRRKLRSVPSGTPPFSPAGRLISPECAACSNDRQPPKTPAAGQRPTTNGQRQTSLPELIVVHWSPNAVAISDAGTRYGIITASYGNDSED